MPPAFSSSPILPASCLSDIVPYFCLQSLSRQPRDPKACCLRSCIYVQSLHAVGVQPRGGRNADSPPGWAPRAAWAWARAGHGGVKPRALPTRRWRRPASVPLAALRSAGQNRSERRAEAQPDLLISRRQPRPPPSRAGARGGGGGAADRPGRAVSAPRRAPRPRPAAPVPVPPARPPARPG